MNRLKFLVMPFAESWAEIVFRVLFSLIFIVAGAGHLLKPDQIVSRLMTAPGADLFTIIASPKVLVILAGVALAAAGISLAIGFFSRISAAILILTLIPITLSVQVGSQEGLGPLFKNIALLGGLVYFIFRQSREGTGSKELAPVSNCGVLRTIKVAFVAGLIFLSGLLAGNLRADANQAAATSGISFLVREPNHIKAAIITAKDILSGKDAIRASAAAIIICGPKGVESATKGHPMEPLLSDAKNDGIVVSVCGLTLKEKGIDPKTISPEVQIVENGMTEMFRLQRLGYSSVQL